ncbi:Transposase, L1 containing protein [Cricetulus griseus]|nr:Transposase, L1 containing protein [Cricetulus griseus]
MKTWYGALLLTNYTLVEIYSSTKENLKSKKSLTQNIQEILDTMERPNLRIIGIEEEASQFQQCDYSPVSSCGTSALNFPLTTAFKVSHNLGDPKEIDLQCSERTHDSINILDSPRNENPEYENVDEITVEESPPISSKEQPQEEATGSKKKHRRSFFCGDLQLEEPCFDLLTQLDDREPTCDSVWLRSL